MSSQEACTNPVFYESVCDFHDYADTNVPV